MAFKRYLQPKDHKGTYVNYVLFWGVGGGGGVSVKIGQNRTRGVGSLAKIGHPIIMGLLLFEENKMNIFSQVFLYYKTLFVTNILRWRGALTYN